MENIHGMESIDVIHYSRETHPAHIQIRTINVTKCGTRQISIHDLPHGLDHALNEFDIVVARDTMPFGFWIGFRKHFRAFRLRRLRGVPFELVAD